MCLLLVVLVRHQPGFELGFDHWGTISPWVKFRVRFLFLGGQKFVHSSTDAKGLSS